MISPAEVRRVALSLPHTKERAAWDEITFRVRNKKFLTLSPDEGAVDVKASLAEQYELITLDRETFSVAQYTGRLGWVTVRLATVETALMRELIVGAWRRTAPKPVVAEYDAFLRRHADRPR